jgi:hypothetical protein
MVIVIIVFALNKYGFLQISLLKIKKNIEEIICERKRNVSFCY